MRHAHKVQQFPSHKIDDVSDATGVEIKPRIGRGDDRAGVGENLVIINVDRRQRHLPVRQDQPPPLLQRHRRRPGNQIVPNPVRHRRSVLLLHGTITIP